MPDQTQTQNSRSRPRKTSLWPLLAALALLPLAAGANPSGVEMSGVEASDVETSGAGNPPWVPDECCELAAAGAVHHRHPRLDHPGEPLMPVTTDKDNKNPSTTAEPGLPAQPAVALMLVGMGGFIARSRRMR